MARTSKFPPGSLVRLTGDALRSMGGHFKGHEGFKRWTVVECRCGLCGLGDYVAVDEPSDGGKRHFHVGNLQTAARRNPGRVTGAKCANCGEAEVIDDNGRSTVHRSSGKPWRRPGGEIRAAGRDLFCEVCADRNDRSVMPLRTGRGDDAPRSNHAVPESRIAEWWHIVASPAAASRELVRSGLSAKYSVVNYDRLPAAAKVVARRLYRTWAEKSNPPDFPPSHPTSHRVTCPSCRKDAPVSIPLTAYNKLPKTGTVDISKVVIYGPHRDDDGAWCARMGRRISTLPNPKSSKWVAAWGVRCATCRHGKITHGRGCGVSDCPCTQFVPDEAFMASLSKKNPTTRGRGFHLFLVGLTNGGEVHVGGPYADRLTADLAKGTWKTGTNYRRLALTKARTKAEAERNARWGWKAQGAK